LKLTPVIVREVALAIIFKLFLLFGVWYLFFSERVQVTPIEMNGIYEARASKDKDPNA
jgi:hypothetical protein